MNFFVPFGENEPDLEHCLPAGVLGVAGDVGGAASQQEAGPAARPNGLHIK